MDTYHSHNGHKIVYGSFAELAREIERQTARDANQISRALERARYLLEAKAKLEKKLKAITDELAVMQAEGIQV